MITPSPSAEIYLIRHAESALNTTPNIVAGRSNETPLTPEGIEQSKRLGLYMLSEGIIPTEVFSSPAVRARQTAAFALERMGLDVNPIIFDELQEQAQGEAEGRIRTEVYTPEVIAEIEREGKDFKLSGGESMNEVGSRVSNWVHAAVTQTLELDQTIGGPLRLQAFTHAGAIVNLASRILGWERAKTFETQRGIGNASISKFVLKNDVLSVDYLGRSTS